MIGRWSAESDDRGRVAEQVRQQVGAIFQTIRRGDGICVVCAGPAIGSLCDKCDWHRRNYGNRLADLVIPLGYAIKGHQSGHHMYRYKGTLSSSAEETRRDLKFLVYSAMYLHGDCMSHAVGQPWSAVTFVTSRTRRGVDHPAVELAQQVAAFDDDAVRLLLDLGPHIGADRSEGPLPGRFVIPARWHSAIQGSHVLVVDDTWVSGAKSQSAAIALKDAGARAVTIICVARWLDRDYGRHADLIDALTGPFNALTCPVTGDECPAA